MKTGTEKRSQGAIDREETRGCIAEGIHVAGLGILFIDTVTNDFATGRVTLQASLTLDACALQTLDTPEDPDDGA